MSSEQQEDDIESLPGVGPKTAESFIENGYDTFMSIATASDGELAAATSVSTENAASIIQAARKLADVGGFESGVEVMKHRLKIGKIGFRIPEIDTMLAGGIETQSITEFYGEFGSGKSQVSHQLSVNVQLPTEFGGLNGRAIYIDTEDTFRPERISEMVRGLPEEIIEVVAEREGIDVTPEQVKSDDYSYGEGGLVGEFVNVFLDRIEVAKAFNAAHQMILVEKSEEIVREYKHSDFPVRYLTVDSLTAHFRAEYQGRGKLADRQQKLNKHLHDILQISQLHNIAAVVTNQVQSNPGQMFGDPTKPIGGNILGHTSNFRIYLRKSKGDSRVFRLVNAPNLSDGEGACIVAGDGLLPK